MEEEGCVGMRMPLIRERGAEITKPPLQFRCVSSPSDSALLSAFLVYSWGGKQSSLRGGDPLPRESASETTEALCSLTVWMQIFDRFKWFPVLLECARGFYTSLHQYYLKGLLCSVPGHLSHNLKAAILHKLTVNLGKIRI